MEKSFKSKYSPVINKIFISMLVPTIFMNLTTAIGSMADTVIIGQYLDDLALSVVTFAMPIFMIINMFAALFSVGGCIAMSIDSGKGEKQTANKSFSTAIELLVLIGVLLFVAGLFFSKTVTGWLGASQEVFELVQIYSKIILLGGPLFVVNIGLAFFVRNDGRPTLSMVGMFLSIISDIILNIVFVGFLNMGVAGAALSTVLGQFVSLIVIGTHFFSSKNTLRFKFTLDKTVLRVIKNGVSSSLHFVYQFLVILILNRILERLAGTNGVVVYTVVFNLATVSLSVFEGISQTIQPMVSNFYGEKSFRSIKETLRLAFITVALICGGVTLLLEIFPGVVPFIFGIDDAEIIYKSVSAVRIYALSMVITTVNVVIGYYLQSVERSSLASVMISLRSFVIFLSATFILGLLYGMNGIWAAYVVAEVITFLICLFVVCLKRNKLRKEGIYANMLLLDENVEKSTERFIYVHTSNYEDYIGEFAERAECIGEIENIKKYMCELGKGVSDKKDGCIESEINIIDKKVIIRDNLNHSTDLKNVVSLFNSAEKLDYGSVLGWNRFYLESRGEVR